MRKIGILCASDTELAPFLKNMEIRRITEKAMLRFHEGTLREIPAVAVYSGVCKVNAAIAAELLSAARRYAKTATGPLLFGTIATGERFVENGDREHIRQKHNPLAVDMETASAAHVCYVNGVPFLAVRSVTDTGEDSGPEAFERNCERASGLAAEITAGILSLWA